MNENTRLWLEKLEQEGQERGYFEPLGDQHSAILTEAGPVLIVTFESIRGIHCKSLTAEPLGFRMTAANGYSNLCILAHSNTWYRDPDVYAYFDRLIDEGFFENFDQVVFFGEGMGGYGATAFSIAAPDATVLAIQPQATLDPAVVPWDRRFVGQRRRNFTDRYGYAPDMVAETERAFIIFDPEEDMDAMHATLFNSANVQKLRCPNLGNAILKSFEEMDILQPLIEAACTGDMDAQDFFELYRARLSHGPYLRALLQRLQDDDRLLLAAALCRGAQQSADSAYFKKHLTQIRAFLGETANSA
ncbi:phosphoadenosine phosphosulfate reductase [Falsihalocynthiibacter sp. SS001]|uniref:phosphoadenosine phosphosulfate reductase n=1 Tax=Falsihalocynthiibacter sp. SS001 TaxID=3349698 RepID=UPI0036D27651